MMDESEEHLVRRAMQSWLIPPVTIVSIYAFGWLPGTEHFPFWVFSILGLLQIFSLFWGLTRAVSSLKHRKAAPGVLKHAIAGIVVCGIPVILGILLFFYLLFIPAGEPFFWAG